MQNPKSADVIVIGAGMAGASAAYFLAEHANVVLLERESQPGYHSSGRSAAMFTEIYGPPVIRALSRASRPFFEAPPGGFTDHPLLTERGAMFIANEDQDAALAHLLEEMGTASPLVQLTRDQAIARMPILRDDYVHQAVLEPDARDIDVHALLSGFISGVGKRGGQRVVNAEVMGISKDADRWRVDTKAGTFEADILVNGAGAWADDIANLAGIATKSLTPRRRTMVVAEAPPGHDMRTWPMTIDVDEQFYIKPDTGRLLISPADETPVQPSDVQPEDLDVAIAIDRASQAISHPINRVAGKWAGLRTFAPDGCPVVGYDGDAPGFFWLAGQGGYGIQTSPALGQVAAQLVLNQPIAGQMVDQGVDCGILNPKRF